MPEDVVNQPVLQTLEMRTYKVKLLGDDKRPAMFVIPSDITSTEALAFIYSFMVEVDKLSEKVPVVIARTMPKAKDHG
jgi:hypothetical protein